MAGTRTADESIILDDGADLPLPPMMALDTDCEEQMMPEFDAPQPEAAGSSASAAAWETLASTSLTKLKAAKFGHVYV